MVRDLKAFVLSFFDKGATLVFITCSIIMTFLGLFALYYSALTNSIPNSLRSLLDVTTAASAAGELVYAASLAGFLVKAFDAALQRTIFKAIILDVKHRRWNSRDKQIKAIILLKRFKKYYLALLCVGFSLIFALFLVGTVRAIYFAVTVFLMSGIFIWRFSFSYRKRASIQFEPAISSSRSARITIFLAFISMAAALLGISKFTELTKREATLHLSDRTMQVAVLLSSAHGVFVLPFDRRGSAGLLDALDHSAVFSDSVIFIPYEQIRRIESIVSGS